MTEQARKREQERLEKIINTTDEEIKQMSYKEKQKYFKERNKIVKVVQSPFKKKKKNRK